MTRFLMKLNAGMLAILLVFVGIPLLAVSESSTINWDENRTGLIVFVVVLFVGVNVMGGLLWSYLKMLRRR